MPTPPLGDKETTFIDRFSLLVQARGLPKSNGRVLGLLLICEPRHLSAETIEQTLSLSVGSVSTALKLLQRLGMVSRKTLPGERKYYYELQPDCWAKMLQSARQQMEWGANLADEALSFSQNNDRLESMRKLYVASAEMLDAIRL